MAGEIFVIVVFIVFFVFAIACILDLSIKIGRKEKLGAFEWILFILSILFLLVLLVLAIYGLYWFYKIKPELESLRRSENRKKLLAAKSAGY